MPELTDISGPSFKRDRTVNATGVPVICRAIPGGISRAHWETHIPVTDEIRFGGKFKLSVSGGVWRGTFLRVEDYREGVNNDGQNRLELDGYQDGRWWFVRNRNHTSDKQDLLAFPKATIPYDKLVQVEVRCKLSSGQDGYAELWVEGEKKGRYDGPTWYDAKEVHRPRFGVVQNGPDQMRTVEIHEAFVSWGAVTSPPGPDPPPCAECEDELAALTVERDGLVRERNQLRVDVAAVQERVARKDDLARQILIT